MSSRSRQGAAEPATPPRFSLAPRGAGASGKPSPQGVSATRAPQASSCPAKGARCSKKGARSRNRSAWCYPRTGPQRLRRKGCCHRSGRPPAPPRPSAISTRQPATQRAFQALAQHAAVKGQLPAIAARAERSPAILRAPRSNGLAPPPLPSGRGEDHRHGPRPCRVRFRAAPEVSRTQKKRPRRSGAAHVSDLRPVRPRT